MALKCGLFWSDPEDIKSASEMAATSSSQEQEAAIAPPAAAPKRREWVQVEKGMLSRVLYPNPVCLLSVWDAAQRTRNVMTITWLTTINNQVCTLEGCAGCLICTTIISIIGAMTALTLLTVCICTRK